MTAVCQYEYNAFAFACAAKPRTLQRCHVLHNAFASCAGNLPRHRDSHHLPSRDELEGPWGPCCTCLREGHRDFKHRLLPLPWGETPSRRGVESIARSTRIAPADIGPSKGPIEYRHGVAITGRTRKWRRPTIPSQACPRGSSRGQGVTSVLHRRPGRQRGVSGQLVPAVAPAGAVHELLRRQRHVAHRRPAPQRPAHARAHGGGGGEGVARPAGPQAQRLEGPARRLAGPGVPRVVPGGDVRERRRRRRRRRAHGRARLGQPAWGRFGSSSDSKSSAAGTPAAGSELPWRLEPFRRAALGGGGTLDSSTQAFVCTKG